MSMGEYRSSALPLARRMLWYRSAGQPPRPLPMVVLLGPTGSGKTEAIARISQHFSWGVVHAGFDFDRAGEPPSTVQVIADLVAGLSREWRHRSRPRFIRFAIALIALSEPLTGTSHERKRAEIDERVKNLPRRLKSEELDRIVAALATATQSTNLVPGPFVELFKLVLPWMIRRITRRRQDEAMRSLADFSAAEGASPLDALVRLNKLAYDDARDPKAVTAWLTEAFLADVRANYDRMSTPDLKSPCDCVNPDRVRHRHAWVLLLDNVDHSSGSEFLDDLNDARNNYRMLNPDDRHAHDPLLVLATSGRWQRDWGAVWRPTWEPDPGEQTLSRSVPSCRAATYEHWADSSVGSQQSPFYPVLLDALQLGEIADVLDTNPAAPKASLMFRATGGLPKAVYQLVPALAGKTVEYGDRGLLDGGGFVDQRDTSTKNPWYSRLEALRLVEHLPGVHLDEVVTAAPFATAPWLIPAGTTRDQYLQTLFANMHSAICAEQPDLIYFAGRGLDLRSFITALSEDGACLLRSVTIMTGDDAGTFVGAPLPLSGDIGVRVLYTATAYPDEWLDFSGDPAYERNYTDFADEFTGTHRFSPDDLLDGSAMMDHDAVSTAVNAAEHDPGTNPASIANFLSTIDCHSAVPGASGFIAFAQNTGNQIDKAIPILQVADDGAPHQVDLVWSQGHPLDMSASCSP